MSESWKDVATRLASRMESHAFCLNNHVEYTLGLSVDCPFCEDIYSYLCFQAKVTGKNPPTRK